MLKTLNILLFLLLSSLTMPHLWGQNTGALTGTVTSPSGAPIPQATITLRSTAIGSSQSVITDQNGSFTVANLAPGTYMVTVEVTGYRRLSQDNVQVAAGEPVHLTLGMQPGNTSDTVAVTGEASMIQDQNAEISRTFESRTLTELPLQDRNAEQLVELMPGVSPPLTSTAATNSSPLTNPQQSRSYSTNGQLPIANRQLLNGTENGELFQGIAVHNPTLESIQQMNITTSTYDASQGRVGGSVLNYITERGTNALHGTLFAFNGNAFLSARDYFNPIGFAQNRYNSNQFGATVGGPIKKDHIFFFASWESDYLRSQTSQVSTVPTSDLLTGNFSNVPGVSIFNPQTGLPFPNNTIPASLISPVAKNLLGYFPAPNQPGYVNNYLSSVPFRNDDLRFEGRIDDRFNDRTALYLNYSYGNAFVTQNSPLGVLGYNGQARLRNDVASIGVTHSFGPSTATELRVAYNRWNNRIYTAGSSLTGGMVGISYADGTPVSALPTINIGDLAPLGVNPNFPQTNIDQSINVANSWSKRWRGHDLRFGVDLWGVRLDGFQNFPYGAAGAFNFESGATSLNGMPLGPYGTYTNSFASFLLGAPTQTGVAQQFGGASNYTAQWSGYLADTIHPTKNLTIDIGIRYDLFSPLTPRNAAGNYIFDWPSASLLPINQGFVNQRGNIRYDTDNWAPRVGLAYRIGDKTVVRGGYGISYWNGAAQFEGSQFINTPAAQYGVSGTYGVTGSFATVPLAPASITGALTNMPLFIVPRNVQTPYVHSFNIMVQRDLGWGTVVDIAYVGNQGRQLPYTQNLNAAAPGTGAAGEPFNNALYNYQTAPVYLRSTGTTSNYNALQLNLTKRFTKDLGLQIAYTYGKSLDYGSGLVPFQNNLNQYANYGPSDFDRTHVLTISHVWQLPFGTGTSHLNSGILGHIVGPWQVDGIFRYATGTPWTPIADPAACNCPGNTVRAYVAPSGYSFAQPGAGMFGDTGRNVLRGPGFTNYDMSLFRNFVFVEKTKLEFRAAVYNISNSANFANPVPNVNSPAFGQSTTILPGLNSRSFQFALRLVY